MLHAILVVSAAFPIIWLALVVVNILTLPRLSREVPGAGAMPFLSFVVPARNEERGVEAGVSSLLHQRYPRFEVIVVDDRSTDATAGILARMAQSDDRLKVVSGAEPPPGWLGKPHALHQGAARARGELLLFVDADVTYHPDTAAHAVGFLTRKRADFVAILPKLATGGFWEAVLMPNLLCAIYFGPAFLANSDWPRWLAAGGGAGNLIRRAAYDAIGGHEALRASVIDDVRLAVETKQAGFRVRTVIALDRVSVRMYHGFREVWDGFTKNVAYALGGVTGAVVVALVVLWVAISVLPPVVLAAAALGASIPKTDVVLAAASWGVLAFSRALLAAHVREPLWTALTQPLMAAVWAGLLARSVYHRLVRRRVTWRGRAFDARKARF